MWRFPIDAAPGPLSPTLISGGSHCAILMSGCIASSFANPQPCLLARMRHRVRIGFPTSSIPRLSSPCPAENGKQTEGKTVQVCRDHTAHSATGQVRQLALNQGSRNSSACLSWLGPRGTERKRTSSFQPVSSRCGHYKAWPFSQRVYHGDH